MAEAIKKEIRDQIIERIKTSGVPAAQVAREHGINPKTVYGWLEKSVSNGPSIMEVNKLRRENQALYQLIGMLTADNAKLKKGRW